MLDGIGLLDYLIEKQLFDKIWLINRYKLVIESSISTSEIKSHHEPGKRDYLLKGFELIPINPTLRAKTGADGFLDPMAAPWRPRPDDRITFINSLIKDKKVKLTDAAKLPWLLNCDYLVTMEQETREIVRLCKTQYGHHHPKIISPRDFEQLIDDLLANDDLCKYHSKDTLIPFSSVKWP